LINHFCGLQNYHKNHLTGQIRTGIIRPESHPRKQFRLVAFFVVCASLAGLPPPHV
jgi:hypothetical protein